MSKNNTRTKKAPPLQTKEEIEKEQKLTSTCAMGMKMTLASSECWRNQVKKEDAIRNDWKHAYQPDFEEEEAAARERVKELEASKAAEREANPLRPLLFEGHSKEGKGRKAYLSERLKLNPQEKQAHPMTVNQTIGWDSQRYGNSDSPLATQRHLFHSSKGRGAPVGGANSYGTTTTATAQNGLGPQSLQGSSAVAGSMGTAATHGKARTGADVLAGIQSISYEKGGECSIVSQ